MRLNLCTKTKKTLNMAKKGTKTGGNTPFFSVKNINRTYKTKNSTRTYPQTYYFVDGKRVNDKKMQEITGLQAVELEYLARYNEDFFNDSINKAQKGYYKISLDINDIETVLDGYKDLEDRDISDFVLEIKNFLDPDKKRYPFLSSLDLEIEQKSKLVYFDFYTPFTGNSHKVTRGESEFSVYDSE